MMDRRGSLTRPLVVAAFLLQCWLWLGILYHYMLLFSGRSAKPRVDRQVPAGPVHRLAVVIPAHNEERVIGATVARLLAQEYPHDRVDVHVIADHCSDNTAQYAADAGAEVHIRTTLPRGRKGYALSWALVHLLDDPRGYDAFVIFDADSRPAADCLAAFQEKLAAGARAVQGRHIIANPSASLFTSLADADMRLNNRIRNQAKANLGLSARLMGDGMCFHRSLLHSHPWPDTDSLAEDRDFGLYLVTQGETIRYTSAARSYGQSTTGWRSATPQRIRWYGGAFALQLRYWRPLAARVARAHDLDALDKLLELSLPPFSTMAVLAPLTWLFQRLAGSRSAFGLILTAAIWLFPLLGMLLERAPASTYRALLIGPFYVIWRTWIGLRVRWQRRTIEWVRTQH